jgi:hypothetical protein
MDYSISNGACLGQAAEPHTEQGYGLDARFTTAVTVFPRK